MPSSIVLPGFTFSRSTARFHNTATGQFVARARIMSLLENQINTAEQRLGDIVSAIADKSLSPGAGQMLMRDELRRLHLQNASLGAGGMDKLSFREYGRVGRALSDDYARVANLAKGLADGTVTLPQAMQRVQGYAGQARVQFYQTERDTLRNTGRTFEQRRRLNPAEHCRPCVRYASLGWQPMNTLPVPGDGSTPCGVWCRCTMETREVTPEMMRERMTTRLERMLA